MFENFIHCLRLWNTPIEIRGNWLIIDRKDIDTTWLHLFGRDNCNIIINEEKAYVNCLD